MARVMAMFQGTVGAHYQDHPTIDSSTLKAMLDNAIDAIMQAPGASASSDHTAMVASKAKEWLDSSDDDQAGMPGLAQSTKR